MAPQSLPASGELGHVAPMEVPKRDAQPAAGYLQDAQGNFVLNDNGNRIRTTENEHIIPRGNMEQLTMNPNTGVPDYQKSHYVRDSTVRFDMDTSANKTRPDLGGPTTDNARTQALKDKLTNNEAINYREDVFEPSIENAKRARNATGATQITDEAIHRGALQQDANLFGMQNTEQSGDIVRQLGSQVEDFDIVPYNGPDPGAHAAPSTEAPHTTGESNIWGHTFRPGGAVDRTMRGANYGFQFLGGLKSGQSVGEAGFGALAGGYTSNAMGSYMMNASPRVGIADTAINLVNTGLNLIPGMPKEVTDTTQVIADATPSSFATSVVSNAGRGLWNTGKGIFTGDWDSLKQQGHDLTHGKAGAPLQGYAVAVEGAAALLSGDQDEINRIADENRSGKRGRLAQWGSYLGGGLRDAKDWADDKWDSWMGRGTRAQRENAEERKFQVHLDHLREERKDREQKAAFDKEMAEIEAQVKKGPAVPGTMLGTPGDPLSASAIAAQYTHPEVDEDGEPMPTVSMTLPGR